ncbi:hypothetical protein E3J62_00430 [candidate division TA06 bacterium]|uniref:FlgD/Vpr Ig-like domain-containing protein n=1 Tax=candidate division TA06 bacterium TaxID=2250710 RepID=A0A523UYY3_UNCT6|nr:MAG: hypothetical protein E3J62_00430 [candidate division TA06 bacterium]
MEQGGVAMKKILIFCAALVLALALPLSAAGRKLDAAVSAGPAVKTTLDFESSPGIALGSGGPDGYGYMWIDSDTAGGPAFEWVGITAMEGGSGTNTGIAGDDTMDVINMSPFGFPFYEGSFDVINVSSNGFLSFSYYGYSYPTNLPLPDSNITDGLFLFWDDLDLRIEGSIWYWYDSANARFIVEFYDVLHFGTGGPYSFEVILHADGTILFQYLDMNTPTNSSTIGIQGADGSSNYFLEYYSNGAPFANEVHDSLAIRFAYQKLEHDVKPLNIITPIANVDPGGVIDIEANILNYGLNPESFDVGAEVESSGVVIYQCFEHVSDLDPSEVTAVVFSDPWFVPAGEGLSYDVTVYTMLLGDMNNANDTISLTTRAVTTEKLCIDDGVMVNAYAWLAADNVWGVRYTPPDYPTVIESVWVYILSFGDPYYPWPDAVHQEFQISIFDESGGQPGTELFADTVLADDTPPSWVSAYPNVEITSGDFWVANHQLTSNPTCEGMGVDVAMDYPNLNWGRIGGTWQTYGVSGDLMMCAFVRLLAPHDVATESVDEPGPIVEAEALINPVGTVKNVGKNTESFEVACIIDSAGTTIWADTLPIFNLDPGDSEQIVFSAWQVGPHGVQYGVTIRTILATDQRNGNNAKAVQTNSFKVVYEIASPPTSNPPTIDGIIDFAEWSDANLEDISDILAKYEELNMPGSAMLHVKNDNDYVYFAIDAYFDATRSDWDNMWLFFDDNNDGVFPPPGTNGEGGIGLFYTSLLDLAVYLPLYSDGSTGDMNGVNFPAATAMPIGHEQYEIAIPLGTLPEELNCSPADTVGMLIVVTDTTTDSRETGGWWVQSIDPANWNDPSFYGKLLLSVEVGVEEKHPARKASPTVSFLSQNVPNPFRDCTTVRFGVARDCFVSVDVFDVAGRLVKNIFSGEMSRGLNSATWDGTSEAGVEVSSGTYFIRMAGGRENFVKRVVMVR